jgi:hypothetical protein
MSSTQDQVFLKIGCSRVTANREGYMVFIKPITPSVNRIRMTINNELMEQFDDS